MISKVKETSAQSIQQYQQGELRKTDAEKTTAASSVTERVDLSAKAKDIREIKQMLNQMPEVRENKIDELRRRIEAGTYNVPADQIAEKMMGESLIDVIS